MKKKNMSVVGAANLRKELKQQFPDIEFSVRSASYSGGTSIYVSWEFGPTEKEVAEISDKYSLCVFDPVQDLRTYRECDPLRGGAAYVLTGRSYKTAGLDNRWWEDSICGVLGNLICRKLGLSETDNNPCLCRGEVTLKGAVKQVLSKTSFPSGFSAEDVADVVPGDDGWVIQFK
jgi:hypothetical protein